MLVVGGGLSGGLGGRGGGERRGLVHRVGVPSARFLLPPELAQPLADLRERGQDLRAYVRGLEAWVIDALDAFGIKGERREGRVGIWVALPDGGEDKIAAIGVRVRSWITYHGISINVAPDLEHFSGIVPCGIGEEGLGVTSLAALGVEATMEDVDAVLARSFGLVFG